jgi:hypothetical protein
MRSLRIRRLAFDRDFAAAGFTELRAGNRTVQPPFRLGEGGLA